MVLVLVLVVLLLQACLCCAALATHHQGALATPYVSIKALTLD